ncbi:hypothetical protein IVA98_19280 [Bradyrhizobium sp. 160]|uniref:hypothetical protein n=1 Tax=unclassified Bradyrhizobium TaxID=2631580 RepID=UPI001FFACFF0|nr:MULTISPECIES: hypothetical protein [unclassified Bradyrhizobium]MCK1545761.1 hypothetical protein [Bradyrhizobium sp. 179]MCK1625269.1 hypothetical protein [Bradyrhizobium sp. 160]
MTSNRLTFRADIERRSRATVVPAQPGEKARIVENEHVYQCKSAAQLAARKRSEEIVKDAASEAELEGFSLVGKAGWSAPLASFSPDRLIHPLIVLR